MKSNFETFLNAYLTCLVWSSSATDDNGEEFESLEDFELSESLKIKASADCASFMKNADHLLAQVYKDKKGYSSAGHDFWLTRNHHGAGFWGRGFGFVGDALTDRAHEFKEQYVFIGDDGLLYLY